MLLYLYQSHAHICIVQLNSTNIAIAAYCLEYETFLGNNITIFAFGKIRFTLKFVDNLQIVQLLLIQCFFLDDQKVNCYKILKISLIHISLGLRREDIGYLTTLKFIFSCESDSRIANVVCYANQPSCHSATKKAYSGSFLSRVEK